MIDLGLQLRGAKTVIRNLKRGDQEFARGIQRGLMRSGLWLQRTSQLLAPVEFGPLKASAFTRNVGGTGYQTRIVVGYTALYAGFVHERVKMSWKGLLRGAPHTKLDAKGKPVGSISGKFIKVNTQGHKGRYWDPQGRAQAKFLEAPASNTANQAQMRLIVANEAFIGKWKRFT